MDTSKPVPKKRSSLLLWLLAHILTFAFFLTLVSLLDYRICPGLFRAAYEQIAGGDPLLPLLGGSLVAGTLLGLCVSLWGLFLYRGVPRPAGPALSLLQEVVGCWLLGWLGLGLGAIVLAWLIHNSGSGELHWTPWARGVIWWRADFVLGAGLSWLAALVAYGLLAGREAQRWRGGAARA